jgi:hypothetical protein
MRTRFGIIAGILLVAATVSAQTAAAASSTIDVAEDTYASQATPNTVHGSYTYLAVNAAPVERRAYVKFTVSGIPTGSTQVTATLRLWAESSSTATFTVHQVSSSWNEAELTWNNQPELGSTVTTRSGTTRDQYNDFDVSGYVTGNGTYAMAITKTISVRKEFTSKESPADHPPQLALSWTPPSSTTTTTAAPPSDPVLAAAGDIACAPGSEVTPTRCRQQATSDLLLGSDVTAVQTLGDNQYEVGALAAFNAAYDPSWGRVKAKTHPAPGNHDYGTANASGYFSYFGAAAGDPDNGYYSYELGAWHVIVLNSEIDHAAGSAQVQWLRSDLAAHPTTCTLAAWHKPRFSSGGTHASNPSFDPFWRALYEARAEVVLAGHEHHYERFAPQTPDGTADAARGIREFVVGTGGKSLYEFATPVANSEVRHADTFGVLKLTLRPRSYDWEFVPEAGQTFTDSGSRDCH